MRRLLTGLTGLLLATAALPRSPLAQDAPAGAGGAAAGEQVALRVCADPDNLPFSNERKEGFENKIAEVLARELGGTVSYTWWPQRRGFVRSTLRAKECDILMGVPNGFDPVLATTPLYRSTYYFVTRTDRGLRLASLDDPQLRKLKIGVNLIGEDYTNPPPAHALGARGITVHQGYPTFYNAEQRPEDIVTAVVKGEVDVAIVWGPLAGYFARRQPVPLTLTPLPDSVDSSSGLPFAFDIAMGVRRSDKELKARVEEALARRGAEIAQILKEYNVPMLGR